MNTSRRQTLFKALTGLAYVSVFVVAALAGVILHLNLPPAKRAILTVANDALRTSLSGTVEIHAIEDVGLKGVRGVHVTARAPEDEPTLRAEGVNASVSWWALISSLIFEDGPIRLVIPRASVREARVWIEQDDNGALTIARTFEPPPSETESKPGRGLVLSIPDVQLHRVIATVRLDDPGADFRIDAVHGSVRSDPEGTVIDVHRAWFASNDLPVPEPVAGSLVGRLSLPDGAPLSARLNLDLHAGATSARLSASVHGDELRGGLIVPDVQPEALRAWLPGADVAGPVSLLMQVDGSFERLTTSGELEVGDSRARYHSHLTLVPRPSVDVYVAAGNLDPSFFSPAAPAGSVDATLDGTIPDLGASEPSGTYDLRVLRAAMGGRDLPRARFWGSFEGASVQGRLEASADDASVDGVFGVATTASGAPRITTSLQARLPSFRALRPFLQAEGSGRLQADATLTLGEQPQINGRAEGEVAKVRVGDVSAQHASFEVSARGALDRPFFDAHLESRGANAAFLHATHLEVDAEGPLRAPSINVRGQIRDVGRIRASTALDIGAGVTATDTVLRVTGPRPLTARVQRVEVAGSDVHVRNVHLEGLGAPLEAGLRMSGNRLHLRARGRGLELGRIAAWIPDAPRAAGLLSLDVDLTTSPDGFDGHADVALLAGKIDGISEDLRARVSLRARDAATDLEAEASLDAITGVTVEASGLQLQGPPWSPSAWTQAVGRIEAGAKLDVRRLARIVGEEALPVRDPGGEVEADLRLRRHQRGGPALVDLRVTTRRLEMTVGEDASGTRVEGIDAEALVFADTRAGQVEARMTLLHEDANVLYADLEMQVPFEELIRRPTDARDLLAQADWSAGAVIPRQKLASLPSFVRPSGVLGRVEGNVTMRGPLLDPSVSLRSKITGMRLAGDVPGAPPQPLDLHVQASFDRDKGEASAHLETDDHRVATLSTEVDLNPASFVDAEASEPAWALSGRMDLDLFPVRTLAPLAGLPLDGCVTGHVRLEDLHRAASLDAKLWSSRIRVGENPPTKAQLQMRISDGELATRARLEQSDGHLDAALALGVSWGAELAPSPAADARATVRVKASNFDLNALRAPLGVGELEGKLEADAYFDAPLAAPSTGRVHGHFALEDGLFNDATIGQRLEGIKATLRVDERGVATLEGLEVRAGSGRLSASGVARLDGLRPLSARAKVRIPEDSPLPLVFQGVDYGSAAGKVDLTAKWSDRLELRVEVPELDVELPPKPSAQVQKLDLDETIEVGVVPERGGAFRVFPTPSEDDDRPDTRERAGGAGLPMRIVVELGDDVRLSRPTDLRAELRGRTTIELGRGEPRISGQLEVPRGEVDLRGRRFEIVNATLSVNPDDPDNPVISATAQYDAPGGYTVTASFTGTVEQGELTLTSSPSLPQAQILNLVAFGTPAGPAGAESGGGGTSAAAGILGGKVTQGLNALIGGVTSLDVQTRLDTSHEDVRPEVAVQLNPEVSAQVTFIPTEPSPGQNPDRTLLTLEYRFLPRWTLEATVGDEGTSVLDLLWRYRY